MKKFMEIHAEWALIGTGIVLAALIGWFMVWGVTTLARDIGASLADPQSPNTGTRFDITGAKTLNFKGLAPQ